MYLHVDLLLLSRFWFFEEVRVLQGGYGSKLAEPGV